MIFRRGWALLCVALLMTAARADDTARVHAVSQAYFEWRTQIDSLRYPPLDTQARISRLLSIPDPSYQQSIRDAAHARQLLRQLDGIRPEQLSHEDRNSLGILRWDLDNFVTAPRYYWFEFPVGPYGNRLTPINDILSGHVFRQTADLEDHLRLLRQYPGFVRGLTQKLRGQKARGMVTSVGEIRVALAFIASLMSEGSGGPFVVDPSRLIALPQAQRERFAAQAAAIVREQIDPALRALLTYLGGEYGRRAPADSGLAQYAGGRDYYAWLVRLYTSTDLTPQQIHDIGLRRVENLERDLQALGAELGLHGGVPKLRAQVATDRRFYAKTAAEVEGRLNAYLRRIEPIMPRYFSNLPKAPYAVQRLKPQLEGGLTFGYYQDPTADERRGIYWFNGSSLDQRPLLFAGALIYHEIIPGHHLQHRLQMENEALPMFRRYGGSNAFDEGWATYASTLAGDMGMYQDPLDRWGLLADELMLATRLVVDTGLNAFGWSEARAAEYMRAHTFVSEREIATELLRYGADIPGQGLSYEMVSQRMRELRERELARHGAAFDLRRFHDAMVSSGAMPLQVLDEHVRWMMASSKGAKAVAPRLDGDLARDILREQVEIDTTHARGSTRAAQMLANRFLAAGFPATDVNLIVPPDHPSKGNLLVRLRGTGRKRPILYVAHLDVVEARPEDWSVPPFELTERNGWLYGRGVMDMKGQYAAVAAALIRLRDEGRALDRDIIAAFTADEESGGDANGVQYLLATHRDLIDAEFAVNPDGGEAGMKAGHHLYLGIQTSEKVLVSFGLEATDVGGHSSRPTAGNPIHRLARAVERLSRYRFPLHMTETTRLYFDRRSTLENEPTRADMLSAAAHGPDPAAIERLSAAVETNILLRSTCTVTQIQGGHAENALPQRATATVQCRLVPGETSEQIQAALETVIADPSIRVWVMTAAVSSPESPPLPALIAVVEQVVHSIWPEVVVLPEMSAAGSDSRFLRAAGIPSYGIDGMFDDIDDVRVHGRDERIGVEAFHREVRFSYELMRCLGQLGVES